MAKLAMHSLSRFALLVLVLVLGACVTTSEKYDPPKVDLVGLEPLQSADGKPRFNVKLRVVNPNDRDITIKGAYYEISVEGHELFTGASDGSRTIPAYGENTVTLEAAPSLFGAIGLFKSLLSSGEQMQSINYKLYTKLSIAGVPMPIRIKEEGKLDLGAPVGGGSEGAASGKRI